MQNLIITTSKIKKELLLKRSLDNVITNEKIMTLKEFKNLVLGEIDSLGLISLSKKFGLSLNATKVYSDNVLYRGDKLSKYYEYLKENNLIKKQNKITFNNVFVINEVLDDYLVNYLKDANLKYFSFLEEYDHDLYIFNDYEKEILWVASEIIKLNVPLSKVKLVEVKPEYIKTIKFIFSKYNIPINIEDEEGINKTKMFMDFFNELSITKDLNIALSKIKKGEIYNKIVEYFNSSNYNEFDNLTLKLIYEDFKKIKKNVLKIKDAVECINLNDIYCAEFHYFFLGFNDSFPKVYKDEDFYSDTEKEKLSIMTSIEKNKHSKKWFLNMFKGIKNLYLSYSKESTFQEYNKSLFIKDNNVKEIKIDNINLNLSNKYNRIYFAKMLDDFVKFGELSCDLKKLNNTYDINYLSYSNKFTGINKNKVDYPFTLSYSSVKTYYECAFKYYIEKILKINNFEDTLAIHIGNVYHLVLSKIYDDDFSFEQIYDGEVDKLELSCRDKFFLINLKDELKKIIEFLLEFNNHTLLNKNLCENEFVIENVIDTKMHFKGFIDNIKYSDVYDLMIVIDYKTGGVEASLDSLNHGFNMQLPSYLYLMSEKMPKYKVIGAYLDKILDSPSLNEDEKSIRNKLKFVGYSTTNENELEKLDSSYASSRYIKSLKLTKNGFYVYSKVLDEKNFVKIKDIAKEKIIEAGENILNADFSINPKDITGVVKKCNYCKYKDICYMTNADVVTLENTKLKDIL